MGSTVQIDKQFNISLKKVKGSLKLKPNDTFSIQTVNTDTITLKKIGGEDPFIKSVKNPAHIHKKKKFDLDRLEKDLWSA
jgi:hypothetical protein